MGSLCKIRFLILSAAVMLLTLSCASLSPNGVGRVKSYSIVSERLPESFDGYRIAFISDIHYPSLFTRQRLGRLVRKLRSEKPSILLLGGDYVTDDSYICELFDSLSSVPVKDGIYAVLGNHERRNSSLIENSMEKSGIKLMKNEAVCVESGEGAFVRIAGAEDSFGRDVFFDGCSVTLSDSVFTILLCHTPDYAECNSVDADLVLSGHTHGGQVSLFGVYTPVKNSAYGTRFLRGRNRTTKGVEVITTNGVGTSRRKLRFCVPSEIVLVTLFRQSP